MSQRPTKFGNVVARNQLTGTDGLPERAPQSWPGWGVRLLQTAGLGMPAGPGVCFSSAGLPLSQGTPNSPRPLIFQVVGWLGHFFF